MLKRAIIIFLGAMLLSGCSDGFRGYFKKSANNKIIDSKGFAGGKRAPLYNKKYIAVAKKNVVEENFDDDDEDLLSEVDTETINPTLRNRKMYLKMINNDSKRSINSVKKDEQGRLLLNSASDKVKKVNKDNQDNQANVKLQKELEQIKILLDETKKDLAKYSCQTQNNDTVLPNILKSTGKKDNLIEADNLKADNLKALSGKMEMKKKFLSEDYDDARVNNISDKNGNNVSRTNSPIKEQEKLELPARAI
jgi:hypothetical protein